MIDVQLGNVRKFSLDDFKVAADEASIIAETDFMAPTFTAADPSAGIDQCKCDNFVLETHYKVYFDQDETTANSFLIKDFKVDIIYGEISLDCDATEKYTFNLKTSVTYLQNEGDRVYSGSPGYLRGSPVIIGETFFPPVDTTTVEGSQAQPLEQIKIDLSGFPLRGAQNDGTCYYVDQLVSDPEIILS